MNYFSECLTKFQSLTDVARDAYGGLEAFAATLEIEESYNVKLSFLVILVAIGELDEDDIVDYLIAKFKVSSETAKKIKDELAERVLDPALEKTIEIKPSADFSVSKETIINLFSERLTESIKADPEVIKGLNILIFKILNNEEDLEDKIVEILYNNNERLTSVSITFDGREVSPTISNWLKDFIKANGSEMFDELKMAEYLSSSPNAKKLNPAEKDLLRKLLKLYRNLVFFPESMGNDPIEDWQIIPVDKVEKEREKNKSDIFQDVLNDEKKIGDQEQASSGAIASGNLRVQKQVQKKIENTPLNELERILTQYAPDSLEYKAVKQEISRLKNKK